MVRTPLNILLERSCGKFGTDSVYGNINALNYEGSASYHKVNANPTFQMMLSGSSTSSYVTGVKEDNWVCSIIVTSY